MKRADRAGWCRRDADLDSSILARVFGGRVVARREALHLQRHDKPPACKLVRAACSALPDFDTFFWRCGAAFFYNPCLSDLCQHDGTTISQSEFSKIASSPPRGSELKFSRAEAQNSFEFSRNVLTVGQLRFVIDLVGWEGLSDRQRGRCHLLAARRRRRRYHGFTPSSSDLPRSSLHHIRKDGSRTYCNNSRKAVEVANNRALLQLDLLVMVY